MLRIRDSEALNSTKENCPAWKALRPAAGRLLCSPPAPAGPVSSGVPAISPAAWPVLVRSAPITGLRPPMLRPVLADSVYPKRAPRFLLKLSLASTMRASIIT